MSLLALCFSFCVSVLPANEENRPSLDITMEVFPSKIQYGDAIFAVVKIKNNTNETLVVPSRLVRPYLGDKPFLGTVIQLLKGEEVIYEWRDTQSLDLIEGGDMSMPPPYELTEHYPRKNLKAGESHVIGMRVLWCPQYEFSSYPFVRIDFERFVGTGRRFARTRMLSDFQIGKFENMLASQNDFVLSPDITVFAIDLLNPDKQFRFYPNSMGTIDVRQPENVPLRIFARSSETKELLTRWFLEIPSTRSPHFWSLDGIFASPFYVSGSPYNVSASSLREMLEKRDLAHEEYMVFYKAMESRTPEVEARIKRTNELAEKLLALPDSEVSLNLKEFITLRGLLVDLRYADENDEARDKAFDKIVDWLKTSKYKTLWVLVLKECGFQGISNANHFSMAVVDRYVKKLAEAFPDEINASLANIN